MTSSRNLLAVAVVVTSGLMAATRVGVVPLAVTAGVIGNIAIPAVWAASSMTIRRAALPAATAAGTVLVLMALLGWRDGVSGGSHMLAGLVGGWALGLGWRVLPMLVVMALALVPVIYVELEGVSVIEATGELNAENRRVFAEGLPAGLSESERAAALADFDEMSAAVFEVQRRLWPAVLLIGLMIQAAVALAVGWLVVRLVHGAAPRPAMRPWEAWRAPFVSVWMLIGGLAAAITRVQALETMGWSLALLAGLLLGIQGLALQTWFVRRLLSPVGRTLYWVLGALFFAPVLLGGGAVLGLVDQWRDLRLASGLDGSGEDEDDES